MTRPIIQADVTPVLRAIDEACERMRALPCSTPAQHALFAKAAMQELGKIAQAKQRYDEQIPEGLPWA